jgi:hypothetical protein
MMICDGNVVADIDVADETASPGLQMWSERTHLCSQSIGACAWLASLLLPRCLYVAIVYTGRYRPTRCKDGDSNPIIRLEKRVAM